MDINKLLIYEAPTWTEYIGFSWGQDLAAKFLARKVNRKLKRYNNRLERQRWLTSKGETTE